MSGIVLMSDEFEVYSTCFNNHHSSYVCNRADIKLGMLIKTTNVVFHNNLNRSKYQSIELPHNGESKQRDGSLFYTLKILLTVNPVNLDNCLKELPSSSFRYFKASACICGGASWNKAKSILYFFNTKFLISLSDKVFLFLDRSRHWSLLNSLLNFLNFSMALSLSLSNSASVRSTLTLFVLEVYSL